METLLIPNAFWSAPRQSRDVHLELEWKGLFFADLHPTVSINTQKGFLSYVFTYSKMAFSTRILYNSFFMLMTVLHSNNCAHFKYSSLNSLKANWSQFSIWILTKAVWSPKHFWVGRRWRSLGKWSMDFIYMVFIQSLRLLSGLHLRVIVHPLGCDSFTQRQGLPCKVPPAQGRQHSQTFKHHFQEQLVVKYLAQRYINILSSWSGI